MKLFFKQSAFFLNHTDIIPPKSYYEKNHITDSSKFSKKKGQNCLTKKRTKERHSSLHFVENAHSNEISKYNIILI